MARSFYTSVDLQKNQLLQAVIHSSGTAPASPIAGQVWYDSTNNQFKIYNGTAWVAYLLSTSSLATIAAATASAGDITASNQKITNLADPVSAQDAATKFYVDGRLNGLDWKQSVRLATTANVSLTSSTTPLSIDGFSVAAGDRILVKDQGTTSQNGIYVVVYSAPNYSYSRATDADSTTEITANMAVFVEQGSANEDTGWTVSNLTATSTWTLGTDPILFTQFTGLGRVVAGNGIDATGNTLNVIGTTSRISVGTAVDIDSNYVGQASITTVGALTSGSLGTGFSTVDVARGGTGAATFTSGYLKANGTTAFTTVAAIPVADVTNAITRYTNNSTTFTPTGAGPLYTITWTVAAATHNLPVNAYNIAELKRKTATNVYEVVDVDISWNSSTGAVTLTWYVTSNTTTSSGDYVLTILG